MGSFSWFSGVKDSAWSGSTNLFEGMTHFVVKIFVQRMLYSTEHSCQFQHRAKKEMKNKTETEMETKKKGTHIDQRPEYTAQQHRTLPSLFLPFYRNLC